MSHQNFREKLQELSRKPGGCILTLFFSRPFLARLRNVGVDFVEFDEITPSGDWLGTYIFPMRELTGIRLDDLEVRRASFQRLLDSGDV